ncbi:hypothetical protein PT974_04307 [Cladobotryum mycophilum]|uniref:Uncharacterized protein n=1 Tax=Cladobotryum mycophilum TaxID=491253 RepID=A0ABR0SUS8_9HYPO
MESRPPRNLFSNLSGGAQRKIQKDFFRIYMTKRVLEKWVEEQIEIQKSIVAASSRADRSPESPTVSPLARRRAMMRLALYQEEMGTLSEKTKDTITLRVNLELERMEREDQERYAAAIERVESLQEDAFADRYGDYLLFLDGINRDTAGIYPKDSVRRRQLEYIEGIPPFKGPIVDEESAFLFLISNPWQTINMAMDTETLFVRLWRNGNRPEKPDTPLNDFVDLMIECSGDCNVPAVRWLIAEYSKRHYSKNESFRGLEAKGHVGRLAERFRRDVDDLQRLPSMFEGVTEEMAENIRRVAMEFCGGFVWDEEAKVFVMRPRDTRDC